MRDIEQRHGIQIGRSRNQFSRSTLTVYAAEAEQFDAASVDIRAALGSSVFEARVPISDKDAKLEIIGHNGVRMASVATGSVLEI